MNKKRAPKSTVQQKIIELRKIGMSLGAVKGWVRAMRRYRGAAPIFPAPGYMSQPGAGIYHKGGRNF